MGLLGLPGGATIAAIGTVRGLQGVAVRMLDGQAWFFGLALFYVAVAWVLTQAYGQELRLGLYGNVQLAFFFSLAMVCVLARVVWTLARERPARPLRPVWRDLVGDFAIGRRVVVGLPALILLPLTLSAYTSLKKMIPVIAPFAWDAPLAALDARLHGGVQPWVLLQPLFDEPAAIHWTDWAYGPLWFWVLLLMQFWQTFSLHAARTRFLLTFVLCWAILGTVSAMIFSSAGPVYYGAFVNGADPFAPLLAHLHGMAESTRLLAVQAQDELWRTYAAGDLTLAAGISAMPSMHIAMAMLLVLASWRLGRIARVLSCLYLTILMIGSVVLAWHYAIDGYAAIAGTWAIWWAVGRALDWRERQAGPAGAVTKTAEMP